MVEEALYWQRHSCGERARTVNGAEEGLSAGRSKIVGRPNLASMDGSQRGLGGR